MRNFPFPNPETKICASIGFPNKKTKSPFMHNAGFESLNLNFLYLGLEVQSIEDTLIAMKSLGFRGFSVSMPFKQEIIPLLDEVDASVEAIGACNTVVNEDGNLIGYNSDWTGGLNSLTARMDLEGKKVLVLGAGGVSRAFVYGLIENKAKVTVLNRTVSKAKKLAKEFKIDYGDINDASKYRDYDVLINATSVGTKSTEDCDCRLCQFLGLSKNSRADMNKNIFFDEEKLALDVVFQRNETEFTKAAEEKKFNVIYGHEMLVEQGAYQFKLFTDHEAPKDVMYGELKKYLED